MPPRTPNTPLRMHPVVALGVLMTLMAPSAFGIDIANVGQNAGTSAQGIGDFLKVFVMVFGFIAAGLGLYGLIKRESSTNLAVTMLIVGSLMLAAGAFMDIILTSLGLTPKSLAQGAGTGANGVQLLDDFRAALGKLWLPFVIITKVLGFGLFIWGLAALINASSPRASTSYKSAFAAILIGAILFNVTGMIDVMTSSLFETNYVAQTFDYHSTASGAGNPQAISAIKFAFTIVAIVGFFGFVLGLTGLYKSINGHNNEGLGSSLTKLIGGSLALNLDQVIKALGGTTSDAGFQSIVKFFVGGS